MPPATYPYFWVGPMSTSPFGANSALIRARIGASARQSPHQCAQKKISAGLPFGKETPSSAGAGFPSRLSRWMFFWMRVRIDVA